jgi:hypothetical protein
MDSAEMCTDCGAPVEYHCSAHDRKKCGARECSCVDCLLSCRNREIAWCHRAIEDLEADRARVYKVNEKLNGVRKFRRAART